MNEKSPSMADERTPLIAVVHVAPPRQRYPHQNLRRICTAVLSLVLVAAVGILLFLWFFIPECLPSAGQDCKAPRWQDAMGFRTHTSGLTYEELQEVLAATPEEQKAREWSQYYTSGPHLAGKNLSQAVWTRERWEEWGVKSEIVAYDVYINYPVGKNPTRVALLESTSKSDVEDMSKAKWKTKYEAIQEEDALKQDPTSGLAERVPIFHGYSASGNVTAPYVFANYGTYQDYEDLLAANITLEGKIALVKYGGIFRGLKVKRAQELGAVGTIIYTDPGDDGEITEANGYDTYPNGPARNPSSVQRGSTQFLSICPGDPTTCGYPSKPGVPRQSPHNSVPQIPSVPLSYVDALPLLKQLNGIGPNASTFGKHWHSGGLGYKGVEYNVGPSPSGIAINLVNDVEYVTTPLWNVIGVINGTISDEAIVLGNHRDAWIAGGAGDPNSGSAAINEVIRSFGVALAQGWKPLRTIVFASWDGEEYGLVGSTEWVEEYLPWIKKDNVAYINVDVATTGPHFGPRAAPLLNKALIETTKLVLSPNQTIPGQTVYDVWDKHVATMGSGSDFTAFLDFAGVPSVDMGFSAVKNSAIYHYHSNYDSFYWMDKFGDPGFVYHAAMARLMGLLVARLSETPIIDFNATDYAEALGGYLEKVKAKAKESSFDLDTAIEDPETHSPISFRTLEKSISRLQKVSASFDDAAEALATEIRENPVPWWKWWERVKLYLRVKKINAGYKYLERSFLYEKGLDSRPWFKHVVFAPGIWTGYAGATYPGLVEAIEASDKGLMYKWTGIITGLVNAAAGTLEGGLE